MLKGPVKKSTCFLRYCRLALQQLVSNSRNCFQETAFCCLKTTFAALMFSIKRLEKYSSRRARDFFVVVLVFFCESRRKKKKRIEQGIKSKHPSVDPDPLPPPRPRFFRCVVFITWHSLAINSLIAKRIQNITGRCHVTILQKIFIFNTV